MVTPTRTPSGYRLYDETSLKVLLAMRSLVNSGWTASEAARAITAGEVSIDAAVDAARDARAAVESDASSHRSRMVERFVAAAEAASPADTEASLDEILASGSFEAVADDLLLPAAAALGDAWAAGRLSVAGEHAGVPVVKPAGWRPSTRGRNPGAVWSSWGCRPGLVTELGALAFAAALRRRGSGVLYLGADVTVDGWIDAVTRTRARAAVIGIVTASDQSAAREVISALRVRGVPLIAVGGGASADDPALDGVAHLPERVVDAAATVADLVTRPG